MRARAPVQDTRPDVLSPREEELLKRLFSDPTKYPQTLKTWVVSFLEGSDVSLPMSSVNGLTSRLGISGTTGSVAGLPAGLVMISAALVIPDGALACDGASYLRTDKARLYAAIGTTFGAVDGAHFNVPTMAAAPAGGYIIIA